MIAHYLPHGGANPDWVLEMADMAHEEPAAELELSERRDYPEPEPDYDREPYADEARAEAYHREERDRCERETGRPR